MAHITTFKNIYKYIPLPIFNSYDVVMTRENRNFYLRLFVKSGALHITFLNIINATVVHNVSSIPIHYFNIKYIFILSSLIFLLFIGNCARIFFLKREGR
jgi:hypothetical protein